MTSPPSLITLLDHGPVLRSLMSALLQICPPVELHSSHNHTVGPTVLVATYPMTFPQTVYMKPQPGGPSPAWFLAQTCRKAYSRLATDLYRTFLVTDSLKDLAVTAGLLQPACESVRVLRVETKRPASLEWLTEFLSRFSGLRHLKIITDDSESPCTLPQKSIPSHVEHLTFPRADIDWWNTLLGNTAVSSLAFQGVLSCAPSTCSTVKDLLWEGFLRDPIHHMEYISQWLPNLQRSIFHDHPETWANVAATINHATRLSGKVVLSFSAFGDCPEAIKLLPNFQLSVDSEREPRATQILVLWRAYIGRDEMINAMTFDLVPKTRYSRTIRVFYKRWEDSQWAAGDTADEQWKYVEGLKGRKVISRA